MTVSRPDPQSTIARLRTTGRDLVALVSGVPQRRLAKQPADGGWAPATIVSHLADAELVYSTRIRSVITDDKPYLPGYDQDAWAERFAVFDEDVKDVLARWRSLRDANLRLLESLEEAEWKQTGVRPEKGEQTLLQMVHDLAEHDRSHLDQIRRALA